VPVRKIIEVDATIRQLADTVLNTQLSVKVHGVRKDEIYGELTGTYLAEPSPLQEVNMGVCASLRRVGWGVHYFIKKETMKQWQDNSQL
jgi:hypothetical protein